MILVAYLVYRRQRPDLHAGSIFKMPAGVVMSWVSLLFFAFAIFIMILTRTRCWRCWLLRCGLLPCGASGS
ncbi:hypothetical protein LNP25_22410 [Klebsiella variicola subsp. variicola]|nr:hypothetical protein [Klebsiella variicola subsp. variicola]